MAIKKPFECTGCPANARCRIYWPSTTHSLINLLPKIEIQNSEMNLKFDNQHYARIIFKSISYFRLRTKSFKCSNWTAIHRNTNTIGPIEFGANRLTQTVWVIEIHRRPFTGRLLVRYCLELECSRCLFGQYAFHAIHISCGLFGGLFAAFGRFALHYRGLPVIGARH